MSADYQSAKHCLSFDIEEHFQVAAFDTPKRRRQWEFLDSRVERNTDRVMEVLDAHGIKATMFILGWVAERHPALVRRLAEAGHEIASHGYMHTLITDQSPNQFREDIRRTKSLLEDLVGGPVLGYRAPTFSITAKTKWALSILVEEGYGYDSSIFPVHHDTYGMSNANPRPHQLETGSGSLWEIPPSTYQIAGVRIPIAGGGYFRFFPYWVLARFLKRVESEGEALVMYLHPWELDPEQPKMDGSRLSQFRHYLNLDKTQGRLVRLLQDFTFAPIREAIPAIEPLYQ